MSQQNQKLIDELKTYALDLMSDWSTSRSRQKAFILHYMASGFTNATEAARQAGYSEKTAKQLSNRMLTNVDFYHVQEIIKKLHQEFDKRSAELSVASLLEIQQFHTRVLRGEEKDFQLVGVGMGEQVIKEVPATIKDRQKSADSLTKMLENTGTTIADEIVIVDRWQDD